MSAALSSSVPTEIGLPFSSIVSLRKSIASTTNPASMKAVACLRQLSLVPTTAVREDQSVCAIAIEVTMDRLRCSRHLNRDRLLGRRVDGGRQETGDQNETICSAGPTNRRPHAVHLNRQSYQSAEEKYTMRRHVGSSHDVESGCCWLLAPRSPRETES